MIVSDLRTRTSAVEVRDHALAALHGLALGDALGMPTQSMSRAQILADYGRVTGFVDAGPRQRIAAGMVAGSITDDTEQALLIAQLLIEGRGTIHADAFAARLLEWERRMKRKGSFDLLGPSTKAALERLQQGVSPEEAGRWGTTNGAAMRVTPVGIAMDASDLSRFVDAVVNASELTHNTTLGIGSAAAVAAAVSVGVGGGSLDDAFDAAVAAATEGERRGHWAAGGMISARLQWAVPYLRGLRTDDRERALYEVIGTSVASQESVVAALALAFVAEDPWQAVCSAVNCGGDTDTVAAIAGAVIGATRGSAAWPATSIATLERVNQLALDQVVDGLVALRERT